MRTTLTLAALVACDPGSGTIELGVQKPTSDDPIVETPADDGGQFAFSDAVLVDEDGDGLWSPGETATLTVTMSETWGEDHWWYPGAVLIPDDGVFGGGETWFYGMEAGGAYEISWQLEASPYLQSGDIVEVVVEATSLACPDQPECPAPNPLTIALRLD